MLHAHVPSIELPWDWYPRFIRKARIWIRKRRRDEEEIETWRGVVGGSVPAVG